MSPTMRRTTHAAAGLGLAVAASLTGLGGTAASATPTVAVGSGYYQITAKHSGKCLDVANNSFSHAAPVVQARCVGTHNQQWRLLPQGDGVKFKIQARHSGLCLDVAHGSRAHGAPVVQANCSGGSNQVWWFVRPPGRAALVNTSLGVVPQVGNSVGIVADHSGMVLDVAGASQNHAAPVVQAAPPGGEPSLNEQWQFRPPVG
ncbi:RICIN domain-containing protein [Streptomyces sp. NPDC006544]|uniref:RICIN domain-containing protein n=1 Tax=Streptomyces sp. NPDC006544 TaxID=3154583 RepID=UPI00339FA56C